MKRLSWFIVLLLGFASLVSTIGLAHDRKEVAGLVVVFGAEPEPAVTGRMQNLRWRFRSPENREPYAELQDAEVTIRRAGQEYGPFQARGSRREPGLLQTVHIFTEAGEYEARLKFSKGKDSETHTVDFTFRIRDRRELEIPGKKVEP